MQTNLRAIAVGRSAYASSRRQIANAPSDGTSVNRGCRTRRPSQDERSAAQHLAAPRAKTIGSHS